MKLNLIHMMKLLKNNEQLGGENKMKNLDYVDFRIKAIGDAYMLGKSKYNKRKAESLMEHGISILERVDSNDRNMTKLEIPVAYYYALRAIYTDFMEIRNKQREISKVFGIPKKKITGDLATFINSKGNYKAYANDLQYDITTPKRAISRLEIVWGNLYLEKLHDFSKLKSLKLVIGDIYTTSGKNAEYLSNIDAVTGDIYTSDDTIIEQVKDILYVGGSIYDTRDGEVKKVNIKK